MYIVFDLTSRALDELVDRLMQVDSALSLLPMFKKGQLVLAYKLTHSAHDLTSEHILGKNYI